ncbi:acyltransferase family protein [Paraburkholderia caballeronis]|uniref:Peptidoglycan/LPS O-acetylase OafA/YrhL, contains acyltransferase and SGNH-hydrolase domains n=1 Tax=Paraburkholderia caballeronis TaxID=416943 RepID=A0A1H7IF80_9BURK|nr:acyltransferase [Paraburkholderia caballeronis]PXW29156.1 peptidoglycan/LPS O-acetylase OafA/YrhL [Paraburkholderia caballeronis]PXX04415.1 peptidoglycan/LPS O-acetylase OafA/YrhL [Paraburkholderia caballeronis]RAK05476.1 peptidoglycan/LPS O-acetylase OafA/YrhL [Paraburkholderia caballeronis]TDV18252.1 peptidoglycan/LPS O-acetylase OafA/YrhL [Paraburkholderia caballeronis]TDV20210.1 peptidoglycan/LPS O-acetylase OafA/YrhL [Paraburkholderia caballeronis]
MKLWRGTRSTARGRLVELDFVRGIAILAVMGFHFHTVRTGNPLIEAIEYPLKNFGREGVNLFFTLSGFLVGGLLLKQYSQSGSIDARRFIVRRMFKIWPAYYALILFHTFVGRHPRDTFLWQNLTHLQNYYGTSIAQTWSLAVEEHFYLFLPALLLLLARWRVNANVIIGVLAVLCVAVFAARSVVVANGNLDAAFAYTQYRIDSLLFGVLLAALYWMKPDVYRRLAAHTGALIVAVVALCAWLVFATRHTALDESIGFTLQAIGFCAVIVLVLEHSGMFSASWFYRAVAWMGVYSYGIYLWHSLALAPGDFLIRKTAALAWPPTAIWAIVLPAQFIIAIGLGYLTTRAIEYPFLRLRDAYFPDRRAKVPATGNVAAVEGQLS